MPGALRLYKKSKKKSISSLGEMDFLKGEKDLI